ncbi:McrC family protein [Streptomyces sp. NBC_00445]|uniref:McrC family protein n=1 Tax=Streptomyces sp. NBC_00445 TaxID=2975745 RepID=UPI002E24AB93
MQSRTDRMPRLPDLVVKEYKSAELTLAQVTETDQRSLRSLAERNHIGLRTTRTGWSVTARSTVGVFVLQRVRLILRPKFTIPGRQLISWLCYANGVPVPHEPTLRQWPTGSSGYVDAVLPALLTECRSLLSQGLRRDYVRTDRVEPMLRGRLDAMAQATRRYGAVDQLHVRTFERDVEIWENLVCGAALSAAVPLASHATLARALKDTAAEFPRPRLPVTAPRMLARARYNRLNTRYRPAHAWARLVLGGGGVTDLLTDRGLRADSMLLKMDRLWELVVRQMAGRVAAEFGGRAVGSGGENAIRTTGDMAITHKPFSPDVLLRFDSPMSRFLPVDAKYIAYGDRTVSAHDRHQLLTYIAGYTGPDAPLAVILHPNPDEASSRTLSIDGPLGHLGEIRVLGVDTRLPPDQAAEPLRRLVADFVGATGSTG